MKTEITLKLLTQNNQNYYLKMCCIKNSLYLSFINFKKVNFQNNLGTIWQRSYSVL